MRGAKVPQRPESDKALAARHCPHGDPFCPCQDGDLCHYEGAAPWPTSAPGLSRHRQAYGYRRVSDEERDRVVAQVSCSRRVAVRDILGGRRRCNEIAWARWECVWLLRSIVLANGKPRYSFPAIARALGLGDHTSALYAFEQYRAALTGLRVA